MSNGELKIAWNRKEKKNIPNKRTNKICQKLTIEHLFYTISIATNKRTFFKRLWISGHPSSGCDGIRNEFIKAMGYSFWILSAFGTNGHHHEEVSCIMTSKNRSSMAKETKTKVTLRPSDKFMHRWFMSSLVKTIVCNICGAKPLSKPVETLC